MDNSISNEQLAMCNDSQPRKMKYSGVEWIGDIPAEWVLERLQWHITEIKETNNPIKTTQILSLTNKQGIIPYEEKGEQGNKAKENYTDYKIAYPNTIVANSMNILIGSVGICNYYGCVSPVYYVFSPNSGENLHFLNYVFQMHQFQRDLRRYANGILEIRLRLSSGNILKRKIAFPPLPEQQAIADILDRKCTQIDALIANEEQQIAKLKAYKQSVITETVTKGLNPDVPMKDSGVEWIGEIPVSWSILKAAFVYDKIGDIDHYMPDSVLDGIPYIMTGDLKPIASQINFEICKQVSTKDFKSLSKKISANNGDIIFARYATIGTVCYVDIEKDFLVSYSCLIIKPNHYVLGKFLYYYYQSHTFFEEVKRVINSNTQSNVGLDAMTKVKVICPSIEEQQQIADYLDQKCEQIDRLIAIKQQKIEKIQQYKKSVIYEYVTGKKQLAMCN